MLELLLANHPLDCPVCDKGGECPLQDQAFSHGPGESRYVEAKRNYEKPIPISDLVLLDRERCILCDRCTRFADEVAGDKLIHFISRGNQTQVDTFPDEPFASYFSGNIVQICPVGALTAKPYRFKARPWDLAAGRSTCTTCSVGCRIVDPVEPRRAAALPGRRHRDPVNWGWMCDRGRFDFEAQQVRPAPRPAAGAHRVRPRRDVVEHRPRCGRSPHPRSARVGGPASIGLLGGARGSNEDAFAWAQLADASASSTATPSSATGCRPRCSACRGRRSTTPPTPPTMILLGPDLKEELPVLYLRLRDAAEQEAQQDHRVLLGRDRAVAVRLASRCATSPARSDRRDRTALADADDRRAARQRQRRRSSPAAPTSPSRPAATVAALQTLLDARARRHGAAGAPSRQRRRRTVGRARAGRRRSRRARHAAGRRRRQARPARAARRRPDQRLSRRRPRPPRARRRAPDHLDRHVPVRVDAAGRRRAGRRGVRREGRHHDQPRRSRVARSPSRSRRTARRGPTG